jgi:hypothetical protein
MGFLLLLIVAAILFAAVYGLGMLLPARYEVERSVELEAPPNFIWRIVTDHAKETEWRNGVHSVEKQHSQDRKPLWKETRYDMRTPLFLKTVVSEPPHKLVREIVDNTLMSGSYQIEIAAAGEEKSKVTMRQEAELHKPFQRIKMYLFGSKAAEVERYLSDLKQRVLVMKAMEEDEEGD